MVNEHYHNYKKHLLSFLALLACLCFPEVVFAQAFEFSWRLIQENLQAIILFATATSYVMGIFLCTVAVMKLKRYGEMRTMMSAGQGHFGKLAALFVIGLVLFYLPTSLSIFTASIWGTTDIQLIPGQARGGEYAEFLKVLMLALQIVGIISFIRGWVILSRLAQENAQPGTTGKGILHIVGGILAYNFSALWQVILNSLGYG